jgi:hypothetical protein
MIIKTSTRYSVAIPLLSFLVFLLCIIVGPIYVEGDQKTYRELYEFLKPLNFIDAYSFYFSFLGTVEVTHCFFTWLASSVLGLDKDLFTAFTNFVFAYIMLCLLRKWRVSISVAALFILTNYYMLGLYLAAERLKYGVLFLVLSLLYCERTKLFYLFAFMAVISHAQMFLVYGCMLIYSIVQSTASAYKTSRLSSKFIVTIVVVIMSIIVMTNQLITKFNAYFAIRDMADLLRILVFFALSLFYSKKRFETVVLFIPMCFAVLIFGGERINMLGYFMFLYYALPVKKGINAGVLVTSIYFMYASFGFITDILEFGQGYVAK